MDVHTRAKEASSQSHDLMRSWLSAQEELRKNWLDAMRELGRTPGSTAWTDTVETWQRSLTQALDMRTQWTRRWVGDLATNERAPEQLREQIEWGQDMLQRWTDAEKELWDIWFGVMKSMSPAMNPGGVARTGQTVAQIWRDGMQRLIDMQTDWAARWMTGTQEMFTVATGASARNEDVVPSKHTGEEPGRTSIKEAAGSDVDVRGEAESRAARAAETKQPVEPHASGARPAQGLPSSSGRDELIQAIMSAAHADADQAARAVDVILSAITTALAQGEDVRLPGFGSFKVIETQARVGRNPRTNAPIAIPAGRKAVFRPGSDLRKAVTSTSTP